VWAVGRAVKSTGLVTGPRLLPSRVAVNVEFGSEEVKVKLASGLLTVPVGPPVMLVCGGVLSIVTLK